MITIDEDGMRFFESEFIKEADDQLRIFEKGNKRLEMGRARLYEEKIKVKSYFSRCDTKLGILLENEENRAILSKIKTESFPAALHWVEENGVRFNLRDENHPELEWSSSQLNIVLTKDGKIRKKIV